MASMRFGAPSVPSSSSPTTSGSSTTSFPTMCTCWWTAGSSSRAARNWPWNSRTRAMRGSMPRPRRPCRHRRNARGHDVSAAAEVRDSYLENFTRFEDGAAGNRAGWLRSIRRGAIARFSELGFPTPREEDWRFTNVAPIAETSFSLPQDGRVEPGPQALESFRFSGSACSQLVFVNGRYAPALSWLRPLSEGVQIGSLAHALSDAPDFLEPYLARYADYQHDGFCALNTGFMEDGAFVRIARGTVLEEPIYLLYVTSATVPTITHPRNLIIVGGGSQATVVEDYLTLSGGVHFSNVITEVVVGENSVLSHYQIERESTEAFHVSTLRV